MKLKPGEVGGCGDFGFDFNIVNDRMSIFG